MTVAEQATGKIFLKIECKRDIKQNPKEKILWGLLSGRWDSNPRPSAWKADALIN